MAVGVGVGGSGVGVAVAVGVGVGRGVGVGVGVGSEPQATASTEAAIRSSVIAVALRRLARRHAGHLVSMRITPSVCSFRLPGLSPLHRLQL